MKVIIWIMLSVTITNGVVIGNTEGNIDGNTDGNIEGNTDATGICNELERSSLSIVGSRE